MTNESHAERFHLEDHDVLGYTFQYLPVSFASGVVSTACTPSSATGKALGCFVPRQWHNTYSNDFQIFPMRLVTPPGLIILLLLLLLLLSSSSSSSSSSSFSTPVFF